MKNLVLIDTDVLIDVGLNDLEALAALRRAEERYSPSVSVISEYEMLQACLDEDELGALREFLRRFIIVTVNHEVSILASTLLQEYHGLKKLTMGDALLAATAKNVGIPLLTKTPEAYDFIDDLELLPYPGIE